MEHVIGFDLGNFFSQPCYIQGIDPKTRRGGILYDLVDPSSNTPYGIPTAFFYSEKRGALYGDDMSIYWATISLQLSAAQQEKLKEQALGVHRKVRKLSMALLFCFILIYVAVLGQVLLGSMGTLF